MNNKQKGNILLKKADQMTWMAYKLTKQFPKSELFGMVSQLRRASLSVPLNIVEGFARYSLPDHRRFLEIAYGSLKETKYLIYFSFREKYITQEEYKDVINLTEEVGKMLWKKIQTLREKS
ncbi:MAG: four helix bundle protein [Minisyncoccales bacterium]